MDYDFFVSGFNGTAILGVILVFMAGVLSEMNLQKSVIGCNSITVFKVNHVRRSGNYVATCVHDDLRCRFRDALDLVKVAVENFVVTSAVYGISTNFVSIR